LGGFLDLPKNIELMRLLKTPIASQTLNPKIDEFLPCPVSSEVVYGEPVVWILPQTAVTMHRDTKFSLEDMAYGDMMLHDQKSQFEVSLQYLSKIDLGKKLKYTERVRLAWESVSLKTRVKLMRLLAVRCNYIAEVAGLWMSEEGSLFLVSKAYVEGIKLARSLFKSGSLCDKVRLRVGLELCEMVMEVHAAGVVVGMLQVNCFSLNAFGHLQLHVRKLPDDECGFVSQEADIRSLGSLLLQLSSGSSHLDKGGFKEELLKCSAADSSSSPRVVDLWRKLKELAEEELLEIPPHLTDNKLNVEILESESPIEPETADEAREASIVEVTPSLSRALIDITDGDPEVTTLQGHMDTVSCLSVVGSYLISASFDRTLRLWSLNDYRMVQAFRGHEHRITALAVHEASELCISGDYGGYIYAWNVASRDNSATPVAVWQEHQDWRYSGVASVAISGDGLLYSGSGDRTIKAWSTSDFKQVATMEGHKGVVSALMVEGQFLFSGSWDGTIRLWWRPDHTPLTCFGGGSSAGGIRSLAKCPASGLLFSGHDFGVIQIWKEEDCVGTVKAHTGVISALTVGQDWLYSSSWDGLVKAWPLQDLLSSSPIPVERKCSHSAVTALHLSEHDKLFVGTSQKVQVYSHETAT
jgi:WD40 repeat protein